MKRALFLAHSNDIAYLLRFLFSDIKVLKNLRVRQFIFSSNDTVRHAIDSIVNYVEKRIILN